MRTSRTFHMAVLAVLALLPAGCSQIRGVRLTGGLDQPVVSVVRSGSDRAIRACVDRIEVFEAGQRPDAAHAIWRIRSADDHCVDVRSIIYGRAPDGFVVEAPPQALRAGVVYEASGHGWTTGLLPHVPWAGGGRFVFREGAWRPEVY